MTKDEHIVELMKENAELRKNKEQLTKAKEIINDCVCELQNILFYKMRNKERIASTLDKAEQFFSEVVE